MKLFPNEAAIDRDGFITILADICSSWTTPEAIKKPVSIDDLNIHWMNQEKIEKSDMLITSNERYC